LKIVFFTTSTFSDVQEVSSSCVKNFFPESDHILIDGGGGWFSVWYEWLNAAKSIDADWYIHLDEDCFILSDDKVLRLLEILQAEKYDIAGCPDGYHEYRSGNHMALNSFFMILNKKCIKAWHERKEIPQFNEEWIREYPFIKRGNSKFVYEMEFGSSGKSLKEIYLPGTEPYYDFFWVLKDAGLSFLYLEPKFGEEFQTTNLLSGTVVHMWYQRQRSEEKVLGDWHQLNNKDRFDGMLRKVRRTI